MLTLQTLVAYIRTTYVVDVGERTIRVCIGSLHPELDAFLRERGSSTWAIVTAWNPRSRVLSNVENAERHERLRRRLAELDLPHWSTLGVGEDPGWIPESGFLVAGIAPERALELGAEFEQSAIVVGHAGAPAELAFPFVEEAVDALSQAQTHEDPVVRSMAERNSGRFRVKRADES